MAAAVRTKARLIYASVLALALVWLAALWLAPQLLCSGHEWAALLLYRGFALVCHQRPERSFHWCGGPLAVCVRCTGIYAGAVLGLLLYPLRQGLALRALPPRRYLLLAAGLLCLDWLSGVSGRAVNNVGSRLATGLLLGAVAAFYVLPLLLALSRGWRANTTLEQEGG
jgi:uncharacterized membrane protein